jgi:very-short-patch-repair endonuclease
MTSKVLIAVLPSTDDWEIAKNQLWYRIPEELAPDAVKKNTISWLAFYHSEQFGISLREKVMFYAKVVQIKKVNRSALFPKELPNHKSNKVYYQVLLDSIQKLPTPFESRFGRKLIFLTTTEAQFFSGSTQLNSLFIGSPLEQQMATLLTRMEIPFEREWREYVSIDKFYYLDFAIWCARGKLAIECDGDATHMPNENVHADKTRNNELTANGWQTLRFTTKHFNEENRHIQQMVFQSITTLGGFVYQDGVGFPKLF